MTSTLHPTDARSPQEDFISIAPADARTNWVRQFWGRSASRNTDHRYCGMYPEHCRDGQHCDACESIVPSQAATANYCRRYLTTPVPQGRLRNPQTGCQELS